MQLTDSVWAQIDAAAAELDILPCTRTKWRQRGAVPPKWHAALIRKFAERGFMITIDFFDHVSPATRTRIGPRRRSARK